MDDRQKETLRKQLSGEEVTHRYQQAIIGFDLMVSGVIDKSIQVKSNGKDDDKEVDVNGDLMGLEKDE
jgi:hypothetical protein